MGGGREEERKPNVIIPELGAGKYWYVDPRALGVPGSDHQAVMPQQEQQRGFAPEDLVSRKALFEPEVFKRLLGSKKESELYDPMQNVRFEQQDRERDEASNKAYESSRMGPEDVYKTVDVEFNGKTYEAPASWDNMTDEERNIVHYLPITQWPAYIHKKIQQSAADNLRHGLDAFGNTLEQPFGF